ncbi:hypothetical protein CVE19_22580 [Escherichia coli]|nr:hypothetical protein CVE15_12350 [Escherichia coli]PJF96306.1 hypothetical protein CVE17_02860 [Escherichia coli]PJG00183.1 hypothetical protein CVE18_06425 [Escherichia coli]PJG01751.1 hypothetical protein CVE19_22580 [Escherichia coli]
MLARSGKVSMATKKRSGEEINDRQILCGMGIKLRRLTAGKPERFLGIVKYPNIERGFPFNRHTDFYCA